ncbi:MFS transporter [Ktedonobacter sp. SOSP1-85]|uniref:MDR family MFS transporter n=1 Tax=Ktedonobacter sp. SOSP1-85 TaxID=2778367 RepID=UPI0019154FCA|nr:MFS transporter [Ktedonobacter sp. SOSP1-85]GHO72752.1 MFS transporter [Ktedonobacter sp. SOSP1-85]
MQKALNFPRSLWVLCIGTFFNRIGGFVSAFLILYMTTKGYIATQAGMAASAYGIGSISAAALGGYFADRMGRRNTIMLSMFASAATMLVLSQATALWLIIVLVTLAGLTTELYRPASGALIADLVPSEQRVGAFALYRLAINLGVTAGSVIAGILASHSFILLFIGDALTSVIFGLLILFALPADVRKRAEPSSRQSNFFQAVLPDRGFLILLVAGIAVAFVYLQHLSTMALQVQALGLSNAVYGLLLSVNALAVVFLELPISAITRRFPRPAVIALGFLLIGLGFGLFAFAPTIPLLALAVIIWTLGEIVQGPVTTAYVADLSPEHLRGSYQGAWGMTWSLGLILAPLLGTLVFTWSMTGLWLLCALLGTLAAASVLLITRPGPKDRPEQAISSSETTLADVGMQE